MFQFSGLALFRVIHLQCTGLSHSEIFGLTLVCSYPKLIAAYHVLHRLSMPRHPPYALIRFKYLILSRSLKHDYVNFNYFIAFPICQRSFSMLHCVNTTMRQWICWCSGYEPQALSHTISISLLLITNLTDSPMKKSGGYRSRTDDPLRARQVL